MARKIEVVPYDPLWPTIYLNEIDRISPLTQDVITTFYHIGSTAVPGLDAKPTIDILAVATSLITLDGKNDAMCSLGYQIKGENGIPGRRYYRKLSGEDHLFHIHAFEAGNPEIMRHLNFRDYLRRNEKVRDAYGQLKRKLAQKFPYDSPSYTAGKSEFIQKVDRQASDWRASIERNKK